ncbi:hypothetical protein ACLBV0_32900, partial [Pseudomonas aeruginosa]
MSESDRLFAQPQQRVADFVFNEQAIEHPGQPAEQAGAA